MSDYPVRDFGGYGYYLESASKTATRWLTHEFAKDETVLVTHVVTSHELAPKGAKFVGVVFRRV